MPKANTKPKAERIKNSIETVTTEYGLDNDVCSISETIVEQLQEKSTVIDSHHPVEIALASINLAREQCSQKQPIDSTDIEGITALTTDYDAGSLDTVSTVKQTIREELNITPADTTPTEHVNALYTQCHRDIPEIVLDESKRILSDIDSETIRGMHTHTITAAALYAACLLTRTPLSQDTVSDVMNVSKTTIQNNYRDVLNAYSGHTLPEETVLHAHHFKLLKAIKEDDVCNET